MDQWEVLSFKGFSSPYEKLNKNFLEILTVGYARALCQAFLDRFGQQLFDKHEGIFSSISSWLECDTTFDIVWDAAFGQIKRTLMISHQQDDYLRAAASVALRIQFSGQPGYWKLNFTYPIKLNWGYWPLPIADFIEVQSNGQQAIIRSKYCGVETRTNFFYDNHTWLCDDVKEVHSVEIGQQKVTILHPNAVKYSIFSEPRANLAEQLTIQEIQSQCVKAITMVRSQAGIYLPWIERVLRRIIILKTENDHFKSGSNDYLPGTISLSFPTPAITLGELLIHEVAHQYFFLLSRIGNVDDGSDPNLYYSPIKKRDRPVKSILIAYHAFANVLLYYRLCRDEGISNNPYYALKEEKLYSQLKQLEVPLQTSPAITSVGNALWKPLSERIG